MVIDPCPRRKAGIPGVSAPDRRRCALFCELELLLASSLLAPLDLWMTVGHPLAFRSLSAASRTGPAMVSRERRSKPRSFWPVRSVDVGLEIRRCSARNCTLGAVLTATDCWLGCVTNATSTPTSAASTGIHQRLLRIR